MRKPKTGNLNDSSLRQQTPPDEPRNQSQQYKTPGSTRSLCRTFRRLQDEGKFHPDAAILLRASEKCCNLFTLNIVVNDTCQFPQPEQLQVEDYFGPRDGLPGNVPPAS
jgi:hypothetical protein